MNNFNPFVLPFAIGLYTLIIIFFAKGFEWIKHLPYSDKRKLGRGILSRKVFSVIKEVFTESLLHRRIFRVNPLLGYMHMSLAFGWFLLIVIGVVESKVYNQKIFNAPWEPIFFKFFQRDTVIASSGYFNFIMDFLLLFVLSGVCLALIKRLYSRFFGMKKTTRMKLFDQIAITSLWLIFPLRFIAESITAGIYHNGGFLTNNAGQLFADTIPLSIAELTAWWLYSFAVGTFFVSLPYSRYMHIPTEIILIALRKFGIKTEEKFTTFSDIEVYSCPRCGICIDKCQLSSSLDITDVTSVYFLRTIRANKAKTDKSFNCLICGRCQEFCPVKINTTGIRIAQRNKFLFSETNYSYLKQNSHPHAKVIYYSGCMTHLTPSIKYAMINILNAAAIDYVFIDETSGICCGRPQVVLGNYEAAEKLIESNTKEFLSLNADMLVTSCAICYRGFKENYHLPLRTVHHTEFIFELINQGKITPQKQHIKGIYHDPCELGRGLDIYDTPRDLLKNIITLTTTKYEKENALCCGGSLSNIMLNSKEKEIINKDVISKLMVNSPDMLITACPLCKKTFSKNATIPVKDIAEIISESIGYNHKTTLSANLQEALTDCEISEN